jgi:glycosyltransferase involved in cell wall biosynthesis
VPNPIDEREFETPPDAARFREAHALGSGPVVLFLGKLTPRKSVDVLLQAFDRIRAAEATLVIAGNDMGAGDTVARIARALGLGGRMRRVGLVRGPERFDALAAASVLVYPSRDEIFGLVPLEAILSGTPVVVSSDSGCGEIIGRIGGGHVVPHGDAGALAGAIDAIVEAPELWRARTASAAARIRTMFGSDLVARRLEEVYAAVISETTPSRRATA